MLHIPGEARLFSLAKLLFAKGHHHHQAWRVSRAAIEVSIQDSLLIKTKIDGRESSCLSPHCLSRFDEAVLCFPSTLAGLSDKLEFKNSQLLRRVPWPKLKAKESLLRALFAELGMHIFSLEVGNFTNVDTMRPVAIYNGLGKADMSRESAFGPVVKWKHMLKPERCFVLAYTADSLDPRYSSSTNRRQHVAPHHSALSFFSCASPVFNSMSGIFAWFKIRYTAKMFWL